MFDKTGTLTTGALRLANTSTLALDTIARAQPGEHLLVVEDVITTGKSTKETIEVVKKAGGVVVAAGSLIDRSGGKAELGVPYKSLVTLDIPIYAPETCPLCKSGSVPVKPGSRGLK